jgi:hypothetical protein
VRRRSLLAMELVEDETRAGRRSLETTHRVRLIAQWRTRDR